LNLDTFYFIGIWEYTINFRFWKPVSKYDQ
jgi:hypothetical protein